MASRLTFTMHVLSSGSHVGRARSGPVMRCRSFLVLGAWRPRPCAFAPRRRRSGRSRSPRRARSPTRARAGRPARARRREAVARAQVDVAGALGKPDAHRLDAPGSRRGSSRASACRCPSSVSAPPTVDAPPRRTPTPSPSTPRPCASTPAGTSTRAWLDLWEAQERARLAARRGGRDRPAGGASPRSGSPRGRRRASTSCAPAPTGRARAPRPRPRR